MALVELKLVMRMHLSVSIAANLSYKNRGEKRKDFVQINAEITGGIKIES